MNNIVQTKRTPVAGRRPTGLMAGELYFNFADRTIGCADETGTPIDIVAAIPVSPAAPASPVPGMLWYRTTSPAGLYVWFVDADSSQWVQVAGGGSGGGSGGGGGASVEIGDTPPEAPVEGQFWFSTVEPVGLFIWLVDVDSAQWVQVGNGGSGDGLEFATTEEAQAGTRADVLMSPALVQARQGMQSLTATDLTHLSFNEVPDGIGEMSVLFNNLVVPATASFRFGFAGATGATYGSTRHLSGATYTPPVNGATNEYTLDEVGASNASYLGMVQLRRGGSGFFIVEGGYRRGSAELIKTAGRAILNLTNPTDRHFIQLRSSIAFVGGSAQVRWRF